jgi:hypothetical protein
MNIKPYQITMSVGGVLGQTAAGNARPLTAAELTNFSNTFTTTLKGLVPAPGTSTGMVLYDNGTWGGLPALANDSVTNLKLAQMPTLTLKGNATGALANASDLTVAQVNAILPVFTQTLRGLVPPPGTVTGKVLSDNGTWITPSGGGGSTDPLWLPTEYVTTNPANPASGVVLFALKRGNRRIPGWEGTDGRVQRVQAAIGGNNVYWDRATWGAATTSAIGVGWTGTLTLVAGPTSGYLNSLPRGTMTIATAAGMLDRRTAVNFLNREAIWGGYHVHMRFGTPALPTDAKVFFGLSGTAAGTAFTNVNPSTFLNIFGVGKDQTDTALSVFSNDGTGAATKTALPNTGSLTNIANATFQVDIYTVPGGVDIGIRVQRYNNADGATTVDELVIATDLPVAATYKGVRYWMANTTAVTLTFAYIHTYIETD